MAVANSTWLSRLGITRIEAKKYDRITAGPAFEYAIAGKINNPELIIAPAAIAKTSTKPSSFFRPSSIKLISRRLYFFLPATANTSLFGSNAEPVTSE